MSTLQEILQANTKFVTQLGTTSPVCYESKAPKLPRRHLAILTCMDTRLVNFLEPAMGIQRGEAKIIKNAGNTVTGPLEATIRSLLVGIFELGIKEVLVIGHYDCGIAHSSGSSLMQKMLARGIAPEAIAMARKELSEWLDNFQNPEQNVRDTVAAICGNPLIPADVPVHGLIFDPHCGKLSVLVDGYSHGQEMARLAL